MSILERLYYPTSGSITIDGVNISDIDVSSLRYATSVRLIMWFIRCKADDFLILLIRTCRISNRETIGYVNQEPKLFATSIRNNIAYGYPGASDQQIEEAAKLANAHDFITSFPSGYETNVGELGAQLSGGQRQRIALARILVKKRKLLLLDEFSSALDSESEMIIQDSLNKVLNDNSTTTLIVAHRLSTIQNADCILVLCGGRVVEAGKHDQLLAQRSLYYNLVQAQSQGRQTQVRSSFAPFDGLFDGERLRLNMSAQQKLVLASSKSDQAASEHVHFSFGSSQMGKGIKKVEIPEIQFRNVHFHYPTRPDNEIIRGLDLTVRKGETLALVGESGGGKVSSRWKKFDSTCEASD